jgi:hypothetical protein
VLVTDVLRQFEYAVGLTAESADGFARSECVVSVKLTWRQWLTKYLLFGWAWGNK